MKANKLLAIAFIAFPLFVDAGPKPKANTRPATVEQTIDMYPMFDNTLAANLWGKWRHDETTFSQQDYAMVIELCIVAYDYLNEGYTNIINNNISEATRRNLAADLADIGKSSNMVTFVRTFSNRMHALASKGQLNQENVKRLIVMLERKKEFNRLVEMIHC